MKKKSTFLKDIQKTATHSSPKASNESNKRRKRKRIAVLTINTFLLIFRCIRYYNKLVEVIKEWFE